MILNSTTVARMLNFIVKVCPELPLMLTSAKKEAELLPQNSCGQRHLQALPFLQHFESKLVSPDKHN